MLKLGLGIGIRLNFLFNILFIGCPGWDPNPKHPQLFCVFFFKFFYLVTYQILIL